MNGLRCLDKSQSMKVDSDRLNPLKIMSTWCRNRMSNSINESECNKPNSTLVLWFLKTEFDQGTLFYFCFQGTRKKWRNTRRYFNSWKRRLKNGRVYWAKYMGTASLLKVLKRQFNHYKSIELLRCPTSEIFFGNSLEVSLLNRFNLF